MHKLKLQTLNNSKTQLTLQYILKVPHAVSNQIEPKDNE